MLNFITLIDASVVAEPFPYMVASNVIEPENLVRISTDFPAIARPGVFPLSELQYGASFEALIENIRGRDLEALLEEKFDMSLRNNPLMITVRGQCHKRDGRIHTDSKDKILTCLLYLNDQDWQEDGGRLRLLRDGSNIDNMIAEVSPRGGNFVAFKRTDISWHGHLPFEGRRRYIMFNWMRSDVALAKNLGRHKLSSLFKRMGFYSGAYQA